MKNERQYQCEFCYEDRVSLTEEMGVHKILDVEEDHKCMNALVGFCPVDEKVVDIDRYFNCRECGTLVIRYPKPKYRRNYETDEIEAYSYTADDWMYSADFLPIRAIYSPSSKRQQYRNYLSRNLSNDVHSRFARKGNDVAKSETE
jgi:hypothetical protein